jgi:hypothetical protein
LVKKEGKQTQKVHLLRETKGTNKTTKTDVFSLKRTTVLPFWCCCCCHLLLVFFPPVFYGILFRQDYKKSPRFWCEIRRKNELGY